MPSCSSPVLMLGKFLLRYWNSFEFVLAMAFTKNLINPGFMWRGGRNIFMGMCWTLSFTCSYVFFGSLSRLTQGC